VGRATGERGHLDRPLSNGASENERPFHRKSLNLS
jgi:hypothetical protein